MITAIVKATIKPGMQQSLKSIADLLQYEYAPHEPGCDMYESYIDDDTFITLERWQNQEALDLHLNTAHVKELVPKLRQCVVNDEFEVTFIHSQTIEQITL